MPSREAHPGAAYNQDVPLNLRASRRARAYAAGAALMLPFLLTSCSHATPPPPSPAAIAGAALQAANNSYRSGFKGVVAEGATNAGGMPCGRSCWDLTHLERDDTGIISGAYKTAAAAYSDAHQAAPKELALWQDAMAAVRADINAWGPADMTGGAGVHHASTAQTYADLDKADALINAFAPASVRAGATPAKG